MADLFDSPAKSKDELEMEKQLAEMDARRAQKRAAAAAGRGETCQNCKNAREHVTAGGHAAGFMECRHVVKWQWLGPTSVCVFTPSRFDRGPRMAPQESALSTAAQKDDKEALRKRADWE